MACNTGMHQFFLKVSEMRLDKLFLLSFVVLTVTCIPLLVNAQSYLSVFGGYTKPSDNEFRTNTGTVRSDFDDGFGFGIAYGKRLGQMGQNHRWRVEGELSYRSNKVKSLSINGTTATGPTGKMKSTSLMLNGYIDFNEASDFTPYLGAGLGLSNVDADNFGSSTTPTITILNDGDTVFAYQAIAGLGWDISPRTELFLEYRYFATEDVGVRTTPAAGAVSTNLSYDTNNVFLGARFSF